MKNHALNDDSAADVTPLTLLVIDDERPVRQLVRRLLEPHICRVVEASDGEEALGIVASHSPPIDAVLTDLRMPGLSGPDLLATLTRQAPKLPVLVMTSHVDDARLLGAVKVLTKPFEPRDVIATVIDALVKGRAARGATPRPRKSEPRTGRPLS